MAARHALRSAGWFTGCVGACIGAEQALGPVGALAGGAVATVLTLWLVLWLPRTAHAAFSAGRTAKAARRYRVLAAVAFSYERERAAMLSRAACAIADGRTAEATRLHDTFDPATLSPAERAVWLNNRACAVVDADPHGALALVDQAVALRPDVAAIRHTRGQALVAIGRYDEGIAILDGLRAGGELPPRLEAARCRDLARAWDAKGEAAYADDYRQRAARFG